MTFADQSIYNRLFQQLLHKGGDSAINYIEIFQNTRALEISVRNSYTEDKLMHVLLENFQQGGKDSAQIANHEEEFRREGKFIDQKSLSIYDLQTDYLNQESSVINNKKAKVSQ